VSTPNEVYSGVSKNSDPVLSYSNQETITSHAKHNSPSYARIFEYKLKSDKEQNLNPKNFKTIEF
jgi:hypothetical protein